MQQSCNTGVLTCFSPAEYNPAWTLFSALTTESVPDLASGAGAYSCPITWCGNSCFLLRASDDLVNVVAFLLLQSFSSSRPSLSSWALSWLCCNNLANFLCRGPSGQDFFPHEPPHVGNLSLNLFHSVHLREVAFHEWLGCCEKRDQK